MIRTLPTSSDCVRQFKCEQQGGEVTRTFWRRHVPVNTQLQVAAMWGDGPRAARSSNFSKEARNLDF